MSLRPRMLTEVARSSRVLPCKGDCLGFSAHGPRRRDRVVWALVSCVLLAACWLDSEEAIFGDARNRTLVRLGLLQTVIERYRDSVGQWPKGLESVLDSKWRDVPESPWHDGWGTRVVYTPDRRCPALRSFGADTLPNTEDDIVVRFPIAQCGPDSLRSISDLEGSC
jgi:hypothetical protein